MSAKKILEFDCPACGNPIPRTDNDRIRCPWCRTLIVPQGFKKQRPASICDVRHKEREDQAQA